MSTSTGNENPTPQEYATAAIQSAYEQGYRDAQTVLSKDNIVIPKEMFVGWVEEMSDKVKDIAVLGGLIEDAAADIPQEDDPGIYAAIPADAPLPLPRKARVAPTQTAP